MGILLISIPLHPVKGHTHTIHVWYIFLLLVECYGLNIGKYTVRPMDAMGTCCPKNQWKLDMICPKMSG